MPWLRHRLRDTDVWAKVDANAALVKDPEGRVEIVYKPAGGARVYRAGARNLTPAPGSEPVDFEPGEAAEPKSSDRSAGGGGTAGTGRRGASTAAAPAPANAIHVWTDGACSCN